jgi:CDP-glucose 4,6-dehydratase
MEMNNMYKANLEKYKGKKVLITGHTGFKGAWLTIWLESLGAQVVGYALDPEFEHGIYSISGIKTRIKDYRADILDFEKLYSVFTEEQPEVVFHLAAQALVLESYINPVLTFATNTQGTVHVLEAIRRTASVKSAVMVTTDKCYENQEWVWGYRENDSLGGYDPYSASKGAAEIIISSYRRSFFSTPGSAGIASARAGNVIGGGDESRNRLVPDIIKAVRNDLDVEIRNPFSIRPWQHVLEPLSGYLQLGLELFDKPVQYAEAWNFGPYNSSNIPVRKLVELIINYAGKGSWKDLSKKEQPHEAGLLMLDISKAMSKLGWKPSLDVEQAIHFTVDWYMKVDKTNALEFTRKQITDYTRIWNSEK